MDIAAGGDFVVDVAIAQAPVEALQETLLESDEVIMIRSAILTDHRNRLR